jgi:dTMP kinase
MFITFEGPEGSGKTSQIKAAAEFLRQAGYSIVTTREPGGTAIGDQIRTVLMNLENTSLHPRAEILLFLAARAQHVEELIRPQTKAGQVVLCDRFSDSTLAYQGYGHDYDLGLLRRLLDFSTNGLWPDLTLLLDVDPAVGLARKRSSSEWTRMDALTLAFHQRVRTGFLELAQSEPQRWTVLDASRPLDQVQADIRAAVLARLRASKAER